MKILTEEQSHKLLSDRQEAVDGLQLHADGHCAHVGKLSPGCLACFQENNFTQNISVARWAKNKDGNYCNRDCDYCWDDKTMRSYSHTVQLDNIESGFSLTTEQFEQEVKRLVYWWDDGNVIPNISFSGQGETLVHVDTIVGHLEVVAEVEKRLGKRVWSHLYTNGLLLTEEKAKRLHDAGLCEIRFHMGASEFAEKAYRNLEMATKYFVTTVETPAWPAHRDKIMAMLPRIDAIGVKHLNLGQIQKVPTNTVSLDSILNGSQVYMDFGGEYGLDDGGVAYEVMREVQDKKYSFSVLDCNAKLKRLQHVLGAIPATEKKAKPIYDVENMIDFEEYNSRRDLR